MATNDIRFYDGERWVSVSETVEVPTKTSDLTNDGDGDAPFITEAGLSGELEGLSLCGSLQDVDCNSPTAPGNILIYKDGTWTSDGAGDANLGSKPLGGWEAGSLGEAIENAGGDAGVSNLPISSTDDTVTIDGSSSTIDLQCNDASEEASPKVYFRGYVKDGVNASDEPTTVRHGFMQGYLAPEAVNKGQYQSSVGIWTQLGGSPYNRTEADLEVTYDGNVKVNNGKLGVKTDPAYLVHAKDVDNSELFYSVGFAYVRQSDDKQSGLFLINNNAEGNANRGIWGIALEDGSKNDNSLYIYNSGVSGVGTDPRFEFTAGDENNFIIKKGQLQTETITGLAPDTDVQMIFKTSATLFASYSTPLALTTDKTASWINYRNGNGFSYFAGIGTTQEFEISADSSSATFARFRLSDDCTLTAGDGTPWDCPSDDSIVTRRWVEANTTAGNFLPMAGGTMDAGADVIIPSGNSVNANLQVGGLTEDLIRAQFNIAARGTTANANSQIVSWAKPGGNAYFKLCVAEDIASYWNILATSPDEDDIKYFTIADEDLTWVQYKSSTKPGERQISHNPYTAFNGYLGTRWVCTIDNAENDVMFGGKNNTFFVNNGNVDVQPMVGTSTLNGYGLGSDGIVVESADEFVTPEGWDEETQGDPAQQPDQPRSGIAFKGPYAVDNPTQNYYGSIEGVRGGRTNGYKSGAIRIVVNQTGSVTPSMQQAAYFGWDKAIVKAGNDNVATNTIWGSASIVHAAPVVVNVPVSDDAIGYWQSNFYDGSRANALGWYPKDYDGGSVAGIGGGGTFLWSDNGNGLALAGNGVRINSQASDALTTHQWEFSFEGHLIGKQGGQLQVNRITTQAAASGNPSDGTDDGDKVIRLKGNQVQITDQDNDYGTGGFSLDIRDNRGMLRLRNEDVVNGINDTATIVLDVSNNNYNTSIEFRTGNAKRAEIVKEGIAGNQYWAQYCSNGSSSGLEFRTAFGNVTEKTFETHPSKTIISTFEQDNDPDSDNYRGIENYADRLTITKDDIKASDDYGPQNTSSLTTKQYVDSRIWKGTQAEYDALGTYDDSVLYCITS